jgi:signal transduction histidine kinase
MNPQVGETIFWVYLAAVVLMVIFVGTVVGVIVVTQRRQVEQSRRFSQGLVEAQESERARIARELHDDIIQRVALLGGEVSGLERAIPAPSEQVVQRLEGLREELQDLADEIRAMARRAHPSVLEHLGLVKALELLASEVGDSDQLRVTVDAASVGSELPQLNPTAALSLYRVAQEGLRNVARHAGVGEAAIGLARLDGGIELTVSDRGRGLDPTVAPERGLGLLSLTERLRAVQGRLRIDGTPGKGTRLVAWVPLEGSRT